MEFDLSKNVIDIEKQNELRKFMGYIKNELQVKI